MSSSIVYLRLSRKVSEIHIGVVPNCVVYYAPIDFNLWLCTATILVDLTVNCIADDLRQITQKDFILNNRHVDRSLED